MNPDESWKSYLRCQQSSFRWTSDTDRRPPSPWLIRFTWKDEPEYCGHTATSQLMRVGIRWMHTAGLRFAHYSCRIWVRSRDGPCNAIHNRTNHARVSNKVTRIIGFKRGYVGGCPRNGKAILIDMPWILYRVNQTISLRWVSLFTASQLMMGSPFNTCIKKYQYTRVGFI